MAAESSGSTAPSHNRYFTRMDGDRRARLSHTRRCTCRNTCIRSCADARADALYRGTVTGLWRWTTGSGAKDDGRGQGGGCWPNGVAAATETPPGSYQWSSRLATQDYRCRSATASSAGWASSSATRRVARPHGAFIGNKDRGAAPPAGYAARGPAAADPPPQPAAARTQHPVAVHRDRVHDPLSSPSASRFPRRSGAHER